MHIAKYGNLRAYGQIWQFWAKKVIFGRCWGPKKLFSGVPNGRNWSPQVWNMMFYHVQLMPNKLGVAETSYGQIWQFWAKKGRFWALLGPKKTFLGVPNGHNWPPRMWDMMFTHVQPMFNQFGVAGTAYGQIWPFLAKKIIFGGFWGP